MRSDVRAFARIPLLAAIVEQDNKMVDGDVAGLTELPDPILTKK